MLADPFGKQAGTARNDLQIRCDSIERGDGTYTFFRLGTDAVKASIEGRIQRITELIPKDHIAVLQRHIGYLINQYF